MRMPEPFTLPHLENCTLLPCSRLLNASRAMLAGLVLLAAAGCDRGPETGSVRGQVTFKGQPVKEGLVTFLNPTEGGAAEANINSDGTYAVAGGVVVGEYVVEIKPLVEIKDTDPGKSPPAPVEKPAPDIPKKYRQQGLTPLRASIKPGENVVDFAMTP
jgi:hypothetical protein